MGTNARIIAALGVFASGYGFHALQHWTSLPLPESADGGSPVTQKSTIVEPNSVQPPKNVPKLAGFRDEGPIPVRSSADARAYLNHIEEKLAVTPSHTPRIEFVRDEHLSPADRANVEEARAGLAAEGKKVIATRIGKDGGINIHIIIPYSIDGLPASVKRYASPVDLQEFQDRLTYAAVEADAATMLELAPNK